VEFVGVIVARDGIPGVESFSLGDVQDSINLASQCRLDGVVFSNDDLTDPVTWKILSRLRYSGTFCIAVSSLCEDVYHCIPLALVTPDWLWHASSMPRRIYLQKVKRTFDIVVSIFLMVILSPAFLLGVLLVKLTSKGPVFYRQVRLGRFGSLFHVNKLRTMQ